MGLFTKYVERTSEKDLKKIERLEEQVADHKDMSKRYNRRVENLEAEKRELEKLVEKSDEITGREIEIDARERIMSAKEEAFNNIENEIKELQKRVETARKEGHQSGYSDGIADGLRKAHEITSEDRKMMAQIAALAAASHSDGATQDLTKQIIKGLNRELPATTSKSNK